MTREYPPLPSGARPPIELYAALEAEVASAYLVSATFDVTYTNAGWTRFAVANGCPGLASIQQHRWNILEVTDEPLRPFYQAAFSRVLAGGEPWTHVYECSSANVFRAFVMRVHALPEGSGLMFTNGVLVERPHTPTGQVARPQDGESYISGDGLITQCSHCRRVRRVDSKGAWDWVPAWVEALPYNVSHSLCPPCLHYHYELPALLEDDPQTRLAILEAMHSRNH